MTTTIYTQSLIISIIYLIFQFIYIRFYEKEPRPKKELVYEGVLVFLSVIIGDLLMYQVNGVISNLDEKIMHPRVFTTDPNF